MATFTVSATVITFRLLLDGVNLSRGADVTVEHIPGGNTTYVDRGGLKASMFRFRAQMTSYADLISLMALAGADGTLSYSDDTYAMTIIDVTENKVMGRNDVRFADVSAVITG